MNILKKICNLKSKEILVLKKKDFLKKPQKLRGFLKQLTTIDKNNYNVITEIKKKSPSKGLICSDFNPIKIAYKYEKAGAKCISVLTEKNFFGGNIEFINQIKDSVKLPILRKDFIIDEWQIYESFYSGADCILLILAILSDEKFKKFYKKASELGMDVICEVHDEDELKRALKVDVKCIGINNRNLKTLEININTFSFLSKKIPEGIIKICESGISTNRELKKKSDEGADAFLIGECLMVSKDIYKKTKKIISK
jgi:indole-3-glycerol phosphate synthase